MSTMVERVAEAIMAEIHQNQDVYSSYNGKYFCVDGFLDIGKVARAAIEAMTDPTGYMTANVSMNINADQVWRTMIQAALKENA